MKIALVCPRTPRENIAGIENYVMNLSRRLRGYGYNVEIVATARNPRPNVKINGVPVLEFPCWSHGDAYFFSMELYRYMAQSNADIVHACGFNNLTTLAALIAKKKNQKLVVALQSSGPSSLFRKILWAPYTFVFNLFSNKIDHVICASHFEKKLFARKLKVPENSFTVIPNGVDKDVIQGVSARKKLGRIISIGRMVKNKGFHHLIRAFRLVLEQKPISRLLLVSSGPYEKELKKLAKQLDLENAVEFVPTVPLDKRRTLIKLLKSSALFVLLSKYEGQGIVVSEAIAAGVPTLVHYSSGLAEFVDNNNAVGVDNPGSEKEVAQKILGMLDKPKKFKPIRTSILSWGDVAKKTRQVYRSISYSELL